MPYSGAGNSPAFQGAQHIQSWTETSQHHRKSLQELYMDSESSLVYPGRRGWEVVLISALETQLQGTHYQKTTEWVHSS